IVTDDFMMSSGKTRYLISHMPEASVCIFGEVTPDPDIDILTSGAARFKAFKPDVIIALGGGSSLDAAKGIKVTLEEYFGDHQIDLIAIPTTSGSGSEVTSYAIISDPQNGRKYPLISGQLVPEIAILDPNLVLTAPRHVAVDTGMDVLTHAIEAFVSTGSNDFSDALAEKAIALTWRYLPQVFNDEKDIAARTHMHNASCMAGMAFNSAGLGLVHGMAHAIGGMLHIPHGKINAMLLPIVIDFNSKRASTETRDRYHRCAQIIGIDHAVPEQAIALMTQEIRQINRHFCIPVTLSELGIDRAKIIELRSALVNSTLADGCTASNPRQVTTHDVEGLIDLITG
ncbi:TPA: propanediol utilization system alcohol dehydrogenase GrpA, partial [Escherichia coli]